MNHSHEHNHEESVEDIEIRSWKIKLIWSWIFSIPIAILMFSERLLGLALLPEEWIIPAFLILGFPVVFIFGWSTIKGGMRGFYTFYFSRCMNLGVQNLVYKYENTYR